MITTSANAAVAKQGSVAYDTSKAAANQMVRELAIELSSLIRVNGVAYLLSSSKFSKTTGQIISVDGGLHEAFLR